MGQRPRATFIAGNEWTRDQNTDWYHRGEMALKPTYRRPGAWLVMHRTGPGKYQKVSEVACKTLEDAAHSADDYAVMFARRTAKLNTPNTQKGSK
jgi:hypothetical protein